MAFLSPVWSAEILQGKLEDIQGEVEVQRRGSTEWVKAKPGMIVSPGDQINTGYKSFVSLQMKNSMTRIHPFTQFVIGRAYEDKDSVRTELFLQIGKMMSAVDPKSAKQNKFTVTTPSAVAGVRGTKQECSFDKGFGTQVQIRDGAGYMSPVKAEKLPPAVQAMLGVAPAGGGRAGGVGEGRGGVEGGPKAVKEAVAEFNAWIQQSEQALTGGAGGEGPSPILDATTLDYVVSIGDGLSASVQNTTDPKGVVDPVANLIDAVAPSVLPAGSTPTEQAAALQSTEIVDAPVTVTNVEAQAEVQQSVTAAVSSVSSSTSSTVTPPNRPTTGQSQGQ